MLKWSDEDKKPLVIFMNSLGKREDIDNEYIENVNKKLKDKTNGKILISRSSLTSSVLVVKEVGSYESLNLIELIDLFQTDSGKGKTEKKRKRRKRITEKMQAKIIENDSQKGNVKKFIRENKISQSSYYRVLKKAKEAQR